MNYLKNFMYAPGGENEGGKPDPDENPKPENESTIPTVVVTEGEKEDKPIIEKIREALQDWSNKDQADQDFDDTQP